MHVPYRDAERLLLCVCGVDSTYGIYCVTCAGMLPAKADIFVVRSSQYLEMKENNVNAPYVFREVRVVRL
jgi:hypothetical protein